ncbi:MAG TPA: TMEM165/GDT1 family protein [Streptosporangiaceae bacterium]
MNFAIAAAVFPIIFIGELPDKSMVASVVLATRGRPVAVWLGAAAAYAVHVAIATTIGMAAVVLLPHRALQGVVAALFLMGAILVIRQARRDRRSGADGAEPTASPPRPRWTAATTFLVIFVAEWGDLTQILTANLAAQYQSPLSVGVGSVLGLWTVAALAVTGGRWLRRVVDIAIIRTGTAVLLAGLAAYTGWIAVN